MGSFVAPPRIHAAGQERSCHVSLAAFENEWKAGMRRLDRSSKRRDTVMVTFRRMDRGHRTRSEQYAQAPFWLSSAARSARHQEVVVSDQALAFDYVETGVGPAILFLPGSFGTGTGWKAVLGHLGDRYRTITTSLLGYGSTPDTRPNGNAGMAQQVHLIDRIIDRIGASPHVVGHSYGGLSAIVYALTGQRRPQSLLLVEANPLGLLRAEGDLEHYAMFESMTRSYFADFAQGDAEAARHVIDFYGGLGTFDSMPAKVRSYVMATTAVNIRDWSSGTPFEPSKETLRSITIPTTVVRGGNGHPAMQRIAELLHDSIPGAQFVTIEGGSHFLPSSHPAEIAAVIRQHVDRLQPT
jgi:pimeloyl-ACP methyl ester carboxylesterase